MSEFSPFKFCDSELMTDDVVDGYRAGYRGESEPGNDKSRSFFHGWRNGRVDGGHDKIDARQTEFARAWVARMRAH